MAIQGYDPFIRANQAQWGNGWAQDRGAMTWNIVSNKGACNSAGSFNVFIFGSLSLAKQGILARVIPGDTTSNNGIIGRYNSTNAFYYAVLVGGTTLNIGVAPSFSNVATASFSYSAGTAYWLLFLLNGTNLSAKVWADGSQQPPSFNCSGTDATYSSGNVGLGSDIAIATNTQFDAFSVTDLVNVYQGDGMGGMFL